MYIVDPISARQLRQARLITEQVRPVERTSAVPAVPAVRARVAQALARFTRSKRPTSFDRDFPILAGLNDRRLKQLESHFDVRLVEAGQVIARQGEMVDVFGLVLAGRIGVSIDDEVVAVLEPGGHYGALGLLHPVGLSAHKVTLHALESGFVASASPAAFHALMNEFPSIRENVRNVVRRRRAFFATRASSPDPIRYPVSVG